MKVALVLFSLAALTLFACSKKVSDASSASLQGTWKMVWVKDNPAGAFVSKPASVQGDVILTFVLTSATAGTFSGNTPTNEIGRNEYSTGANQTISMPHLAMTKAGETSWGNHFVNNIRNAEGYSFDKAGRLMIKTINKTLVFEKI